jgi:hypothetical protein
MHHSSTTDASEQDRSNPLRLCSAPRPPAAITFFFHGLSLSLSFSLYRFILLKSNPMSRPFLEKSKTQKSKFAQDKAAAALRQRGQRQQRCETSEIMWRVLVHVSTCFLANFSSLCTALEAVA